MKKFANGQKTNGDYRNISNNLILKSKSNFTSALFSYNKSYKKSGKRYSLNSCESMRSENSCRCCEPMKT